MSARRRIIAITSAGAAVLGALLAPAGPAIAGTSVEEIAHAFFSNPNGESTTMHVGVSRLDGGTTIDVDWWSRSCQTIAGTRLCQIRTRSASQVLPVQFDFSLQHAALLAAVVYQETNRTCTYDGANESCTTPTAGVPGVTLIDLTWTATEKPTTTTWRDENDTLHIFKIAPAQATGHAFGETFTVDRNDGSQLATVRAAG